MVQGSNFNPPFAKGVKVAKPTSPKVKEHPAFRYRGALASRAKRVKPTMPKLPEEKAQ